MRASIRIVGVLWLAVAGLCLAAPGAGAYVYWANSEKGTIGRAANDGSGVEPEFITGAGGPSAVAVDSSHVYWANLAGEAVGRANLDGSDVEPDFVKGESSVNGVAVDQFHVFWSSSNGDVGRANIDGSSPNPHLVTGASACGVAVDAGHVYWAAAVFKPAGRIGRASLTGTSIEPEYVKIPEANLLCGVAVSTTSVFWTDGGLGGGTEIGQASLGNPAMPNESFVGQALGPCGVAVHGSQVYWANSGTATIGRINTDGSSIDYEFIHTGAGPNEICGVAVNDLASPPAPPAQPAPSADTTPPQTTISKGPGKRLAKGRAKFSFTSSEAGSSFGCKLDKRKPATCRSPKTYSGLKPGHHSFSVWATDAAGDKDPTPARRSFRVPAR